ncbi:MAG TPA: ABC transporter permease [Chloroflexota bacterium]|nr:ABC transporter permease [Chloroflexota bacterium]
MLEFLARRITRLVFSLLGLTIILFALTRLTPVDPVRFALGPQATAAQVAAMRQQYGLDRPLVVQYLSYLGNALHGDLGLTLQGQRSVSADLANYLPNTLELVFAALILGFVAGLPLGIIAAVRPRGAVDAVVQLISTLGVAIPSFWLGVILQLVFAVNLRWLPLAGVLEPSDTPPPAITHMVTLDALLTGHWATAAASLQHLILPAVVLSLQPLAMVAAMTRTSMLEVTRLEYVRVARAKGLPARHVVLRYVLRNAWLPIVSILGLNVGWLLGGTFLVETVFGWTGIGYYGINASMSFDFPAILGTTLVIGVVFALTNAVVDVLYGVIDPRIRQAA